MGPFSAILCEVADHVCRLTLNRPEKRNPLDPRTIGELLVALRHARDDAEVRVILLTGAGSAFSAGGDLSSMKSAQSDGPIGSFADLLQIFPPLGKPTVAMVQGHAMAGGLGLVAACDLVIAAEEALLGTP